MSAASVASLLTHEPISTNRFRQALAEARRTAEPGNPPGATIAADELAQLEGVRSRRKTPALQRDYDALMTTARRHATGVAVPSSPSLVGLPAGAAGPISVHPDVGLTTDPTGKAPATLDDMSRALHHAVQAIQATFGRKKNIFADAGITPKHREAIVAQLEATLASAQVAATKAKDARKWLALVGNSVGTAVELLKSIPVSQQQGTASATARAQFDRLFAAIETALTSPAALNVLDLRSCSVKAEDLDACNARNAFITYLAGNDDVQRLLSAKQRASLAALDAVVNPKAPIDYATYDVRDAQGRLCLTLERCCGQGEGFWEGFCDRLQGKARGPRWAAQGLIGTQVNFKIVSGDPASDQRVSFEAVVPRQHPMNKWGEDFVIRINARTSTGDNQFAGLSNATAQSDGVGSHSEFGRFAQRSLRSAALQQGAKYALWDQCNSVDTISIQAQRFPMAARNGVYSLESTHFRNQAPGISDYTFQSEGYGADMVVLRAILTKRDWKHIDHELKIDDEANFSKNDRLWGVPGSAILNEHMLAGGSGVASAFCSIPDFDTTNVAASTDREFQLKLPDVPASKINGSRLALVVQMANTAQQYSDITGSLNPDRRLTVHPFGAFFDGNKEFKTLDGRTISAEEASRTLFFFEEGKDPEGKPAIFVRGSSALASMTEESLRGLLFAQSVGFYGDKATNQRIFPSRAHRNAAMLVVLAAAMQYDLAWRDREVFDGVAKLLGFKLTADGANGGVNYNDCVAEASAGSNRPGHHYYGDRTGVNNLVTKFAVGLNDPHAGKPAVKIA